MLEVKLARGGRRGSGGWLVVVSTVREVSRGVPVRRMGSGRRRCRTRGVGFVEEGEASLLVRLEAAPLQSIVPVVLLLGSRPTRGERARASSS